MVGCGLCFALFVLIVIVIALLSRLTRQVGDCLLTFATAGLEMAGLAAEVATGVGVAVPFERLTRLDGARCRRSRCGAAVSSQDWQHTKPGLHLIPCRAG